MRGRPEGQNHIHFRMAHPIEAGPRQVKRAARSARAGRGRAAALVVADFAFDLNHIKDAFDFDMEGACFFG